MHQDAVRSFRSACLTLTATVFVACGGSSSPPQVGVSESNYREASDAPRPVASSPHDLEAPPVASTSQATLVATWWTDASPCPEGATLYGGPPPAHSEVGCKTDKGV